MTLVYGFTQGRLPASLTAPFKATAGEDAFGIVMRLENGGSLEDHLYKKGTQVEHCAWTILTTAPFSNLVSNSFSSYRTPLSHFLLRYLFYGTQFTLTEKIRIIAGIAKGLTALHSIGMIHADLKPGNILLSGQTPPEVRLM